MLSSQLYLLNLFLANKKILANLKKDFGYTGETVNEEMKMKTTISITKKSKTFLSNLPFVDNTYKYTIRIRKR